MTQMYGDLAVNPQLSKIKLMNVDGVAPTPETIRSDEYPLHTAYYIVINKADAPDSPARILADAMLGHDGQQTAMEAGYVPVDETIQLPPAPGPDPNALTSLDETYSVNPLHFTTADEYVMSANGCTQVTRVTVSGLADTTLQDQINARFKAQQNALVGIPDSPTTCDPNDIGYFSYTVSGDVGANFSNVLSLRADLTQLLPGGFGSGFIAMTAVNVRLDTGEDLTPADVFTVGANVGGMIQLEAQNSDATCDETCANAKAASYRSNPDQPFSFTTQDASILGVTVPFTDYWPLVAIFKKYAGADVAYEGASPASCPVVNTVWDDTVGACIPVTITAADLGTVKVSWDAPSVTIPVAVGQNDSWELRSGRCIYFSNGYGYYDAPAVSAGTLGTGVGPSTVTVALAANGSSSAQTNTLCVQTIDQDKVAGYSEITVVQSPIDPSWVMNVTSDVNATTGTPAISGILTTNSGDPVADQQVSVTVSGDDEYYTSAYCLATTLQDGTWSCVLNQAVSNGVHQLQAQASDCSAGTCQWGEADSILNVLSDAPDAPVVLAPTTNQTIYKLPQSQGLGGNPCWVMVRGTTVAGATVSIYPSPGTSGSLQSVTADETGAWSIVLSGMYGRSQNSYNVYAAVGGNRSAPTQVTFTLDSSVGYAVQVTKDNAYASGNGTSADEVSVTMVDTQGNSVTDMAPFTLTATNDDAQAQTQIGSVQSDHGTAVMGFVSSVPGTRSVQLWVDGQPVPLMSPNLSPSPVAVPTVLTFLPVAEPTVSVVNQYALNLQMGSIATIATVAASAVDAEGAPLDGVDVDFTLEGTAIELAATSCVTGTGTFRVLDSVYPPQPGVCGVSYSAVEPGTAKVHVYYDGTELNGSPITVTVSEAASPPAPTVLTANATVISGHASSTPGSAVANDIVSVEVTYPLADATTKSVTAEVNGYGGWSVPTPADAVNGQISVTATNQAGKVSSPTLATLAGIEHITVVIEAHDSLLDLSAEPQAASGSILVLARNSENQLVDGVVVQFSTADDAVSLVDSCVTGIGNIENAGVVSPPTTGYCSAAYTGHHAGQASIHAFYDGTEVDGSPVAVRVISRPVPDPSQSSLTTSVDEVYVFYPACGTEPTVSPETVGVTATIKDTTGAPMEGTTVDFSAESGLTLVGPASSQTDADGVARTTAAVDPAEIRSPVVRATVSGMQMGATALRFAVAQADPAAWVPGLSVVPTSDSPVIADGESSYTATVTAVDGCGVTVPGVEIGFAVTGQAHLSVISGVTDENGVITTVVTDNQAEQVDFSAMTGTDEVVGGSPISLEFVEPAPSPSPSPTETLSPSPSPSPSPTETLSPSPTGTLSPSPTETSSPSPTGTSSPSPTETSSPSPSPSPTETLSPTPTETSSPSPTETSSPSPTETSSPSPTPTSTSSPTPTNTPSPTPTKTSSPTPTNTSSPSSASSSTAAPSSSPSPSMTPTSAMSPTSNPAPNPTSTPTSGVAALTGGTATSHLPLLPLLLIAGLLIVTGVVFAVRRHTA